MAVSSALRARDRKSTRLNSCHTVISYAVFCLKKKKAGERGVTVLERQRPAPPVRRRDDPVSPLVRRDAAREGIADVRHGCGVLFFNDTAATEIYTLSLHDALPI